MSMTKQLWATIIVSMLLALCGSMLALTLSARAYMTEQITLKNVNNANALALALSQGEIDAVRAELAVAAMFDSGQYRSILVTDPRGRTIAERHTPGGVPDAPQWFVRLLPITPDAGSAQISDGWKQFGTVSLESETRFAYRSLWLSALQMTMVMGLAGIIGSYLGSLILRRLIPPLHAVVNQARGITEHRFAVIPPPRVPELAKLAEAMNLMVRRVQAMFEQEAARLEAVRREANFDAVTGLANRSFFMARLGGTLRESPAGGMLMLLRVARLTEINQRLGRAVTDDLLKAVGAHVQSSAAKGGDAQAGRLSGADFALLRIGDDDADIRHALLDAVCAEAPRFGLAPEDFAHIGATIFARGAEASLVLAQADAALAAAETSGHNCVVDHRGAAQERQPRSAEEWGASLRDALSRQRLRLASYPIVDMQGKVIALECPLRLRLGDDDEWQPAGRFLPLAERLRMTAELDLACVQLGITALQDGTFAGNIALSLSPQSIADAGFRARLLALVSAHPAPARQLWLEVAEAGALLHLADLGTLCRDLAPLGCRIGIEHFGHQFGQIGRLYNLGLHYLKIDAGFISGIEHNPGNQAFLAGVRSITEASGLQLQAEGVASDAEFAQLARLGFDAATGPGVRAA